MLGADQFIRNETLNEVNLNCENEDEIEMCSSQLSYLSRVKMNSINWCAINIWVFIAQLVEYCSTNAEAMGSNPVETLNFFSRLKFAIA